jgi:hypothetical protein
MEERAQLEANSKGLWYACKKSHTTPTYHANRIVSYWSGAGGAEDMQKFFGCTPKKFDTYDEAVADMQLVIPGWTPPPIAAIQSPIPPLMGGGDKDPSYADMATPANQYGLLQFETDEDEDEANNGQDEDTHMQSDGADQLGRQVNQTKPGDKGTASAESQTNRTGAAAPSGRMTRAHDMMHSESTGVLMGGNKRKNNLRTPTRTDDEITSPPRKDGKVDVDAESLVAIEFKCIQEIDEALLKTSLFPFTTPVSIATHIHATLSPNINHCTVVYANHADAEMAATQLASRKPQIITSDITLRSRPPPLPIALETSLIGVQRDMAVFTHPDHCIIRHCALSANDGSVHFNSATDMQDHYNKYHGDFLGRLAVDPNLRKLLDFADCRNPSCSFACLGKLGRETHEANCPQKRRNDSRGVQKTSSLQSAATPVITPTHNKATAPPNTTTTATSASSDGAAAALPAAPLTTPPTRADYSTLIQLVPPEAMSEFEAWVTANNSPPVTEAMQYAIELRSRTSLNKSHSTF